MGPHQILGISPNADLSEIQGAYRRLAMKHHPDRGGDAAMFVRVTEAYQALRDGRLDLAAGEATAATDAAGEELRDLMRRFEEELDAVLGRSSRKVSAPAERKPTEESGWWLSAVWTLVSAVVATIVFTWSSAPNVRDFAGALLLFIGVLTFTGMLAMLVSDPPGHRQGTAVYRGTVFVLTGAAVAAGLLL